MRKGATTLQNVQTLKLAAEAGIYVEWLALCGFPGSAAVRSTGSPNRRIGLILTGGVLQ